MYPGVTNTTTVTQETDQSYGLFNNFKKLKILSDSRLIGNYTTSLPPWMAGLVMFGGADPRCCCSVKGCNCAVWKKCGDTPLTQACLQNNAQVRREIDDENDAANTTTAHIQV